MRHPAPTSRRCGALGPQARVSAAACTELNCGKTRSIRVKRATNRTASETFAKAMVPPSGESSGVFDGRVREAWAHVVKARRRLDGSLAVVTHGLVCRSLLLQCLEPPPGAPVPSPFANSSLTIVEPSAPHRVRLLDCVGHL